MAETAVAREYFELYWRMGPSRTLHKLAQIVASMKDQKVNSTWKSVQKMSMRNGWQKRLTDRMQEEYELIRDEAVKAAVETRFGLAGALRGEIMRWARRALGRSEEGAPIDVRTTLDLERLCKLYFQLVGQPLADRQEITGPAGGPVAVTSDDNMEAEEVLNRIADIIPELGDGFADRLLARLRENNGEG